MTKSDVNMISIPNVKIDNDLIERVSEVKYLGLKIDNKLTFKE